MFRGLMPASRLSTLLVNWAVVRLHRNTSLCQQSSRASDQRATPPAIYAKTSCKVQNALRLRWLGSLTSSRAHPIGHSPQNTGRLHDYHPSVCGHHIRHSNKTPRSYIHHSRCGPSLSPDAALAGMFCLARVRTPSFPITPYSNASTATSSAFA